MKNPNYENKKIERKKNENYGSYKIFVKRLKEFRY